jgi:hypothetical protein
MWIEKVREIVETRQYKYVNGVGVDLMTANVLVTVYDNLGRECQEKFQKMDIERAVKIAWNLI